jgi:hypothetical protein
MRAAAAVLAGLGVFALLLWAQAPGQSYQDAFRAWRAADPSLEKEASQLAQLPARGAPVWQAAARYGEVRTGYLRSLADQSSQLLQWFGGPDSPVDKDAAPGPEVQGFVRTTLAKVSSDISAYASDKDRGIQQLRQALERERTALTSLNTVIASRQPAAEKAAQAAASVESATAKARGLYEDLDRALTALFAQAQQETAAWSKYYDTLVATKAPAAGQVAAPQRAAEPTPEPAVVSATIGGVTITNPTPGLAATQTAPAPQDHASASPPPAKPQSLNPVADERRGGTPPVPLSRYTGEWVYPPRGGQFFRFEPAAVELSVKEQGGSLTGTLNARFKLPAGSSEDPNLSLSFSGVITGARIQALSLETSDGAKGILELIPGGAFNLLEVNLRTEVRPGKLSFANFVVIKK